MRATGSDIHARVKSSLRTDDVAITDPIVMEVLAGGRHDEDVQKLRTLLGRAHMFTCDTSDYLAAAEIRRATRAGGEVVRNSLDCLIAAVAIRTEMRLLQHDRDFETIARHSKLELA